LNQEVTFNFKSKEWANIVKWWVVLSELATTL
jgi:hypothetical protein